MANTDPAATKTKLDIPIQSILDIHRIPYQVVVFDKETGDTIPKPGYEDVELEDQLLVTEPADTLKLLSDMLRKYPRTWAQFQGDGGQIALLDQSMAEASKIKLTIRRSTYEWLHGRPESGKGENDGRPGALNRKEPQSIVKKRLGLEPGEKLPDDWKDHQQTVAMQIWGLNEEKFRRYLMTADEAKDIPEPDDDE